MERIIQWCGGHMVGMHMVNTRNRFNISHQLQYRFYRNITKQLQYNLHYIPYRMRKHLYNKLTNFHLKFLFIIFIQKQYRFYQK